jgi:hypothetical protein
LADLGAYLGNVVRTLLSGATVSRSAEQTLAEDLLTMIFWADSRRPAILEKYRARLKQAGA